MTKTIVTFISGTVLGVVGGLLFAPKSGKESRLHLKSSLDTLQSSVEREANNRLEEAKEIINKNVKAQAEKAKATIDKVADTVKA